MADYRDRYREIRAIGASVAAISVDALQTSETLRRELDLPFPILCDTDRRVVQEWNLYNPREANGIAKPALFVLERDRTVRYATMDGIAARVPASEILLLLQSTRQVQHLRRKTYFPRLADWTKALSNMVRR